MSSLMEFLGPFSTTRNQSAWSGPYFATAAAAMMWSSITANDGTPIMEEQSFDPQWAHSSTNYGANFTSEEVGLIYPVNDTAVYIRPTLQKSIWLYAVLIIQPLLLIIILGLTFTLYSVPLDKGFGLISILSGIDNRSLENLRGAGLSGELRERVRLVINPTYDCQACSIEYPVTPLSKSQSPNGILVAGIMYQ